MSEGSEAPRDELSRERSTRWRTFKFISVFVVCVLALLTGYRYAINTRANDWYLYQVAHNTCWVLAKIGDSCELESQRDKLDPADVRAKLAAWKQGLDKPSPEGLAAQSGAPLTSWERWSYRAQQQRRSKIKGPAGPRVSFVLKANVVSRINALESALEKLEQDQAVRPSEEQRRRIESMKSELDTLRASPHLGAKEDRGYFFPFILVSECGAIEVMAIFFAAVMAFPARWWKRIVGLLLGIPIMYSVNIFRVTCLAIIGALDPERQWFDFSHHYVWQAVYIIFVVAVWLAWIEFLVNRETWVESYVKGLLTQSTRMRRIAFFSVKFLAAVSVLVVIWWWLLPYYGYLLLQSSGAILRYVMRMPIEWGHIEPSGVLNTETQLTFRVSGREPTLPIALLVTNIPPYIALVLATAGLGFWRRLRILLYGCGILMAGHILFIAVVLRFQQSLQSASEVPTAVIQFFLTLPFLLWIVFAYWGQIASRRRRENGGDKPKNDPA